MSHLARLSIERPLYPWLLALLCFFGGLYGIENVGRLEDPPFPIKNAFVITQYPGASAAAAPARAPDLEVAARSQRSTDRAHGAVRSR